MNIPLSISQIPSQISFFCYIACKEKKLWNFNLRCQTERKREAAITLVTPLDDPKPVLYFEKYILNIRESGGVEVECENTQTTD